MILNLKHRRVLVALALALIAGGAHAVPGEQQTPEATFRTTPPSVDPHAQAAVEPHRPLYETSGYFTFRIAPRVGRAGKVLAVEIQDEMLQSIRQRAQALKVTNVEAVKGSETDPNLPAKAVDLVLMVDVYHELAYPFEVMTKIREALKPGGRVVFVEYRKEDPDVPIKLVHKMSVEQVKREMKAVGLAHLQTLETLPLQHILVFEKPQ